MGGKRWGHLFSAFFTAHLFAGPFPEFLKTHGLIYDCPETGWDEREAVGALRGDRPFFHGGFPGLIRWESRFLSVRGFPPQSTPHHP